MLDLRSSTKLRCFTESCTDIVSRQKLTVVLASLRRPAEVLAQRCRTSLRSLPQPNPSAMSDVAAGAALELVGIQQERVSTAMRSRARTRPSRCSQCLKQVRDAMVSRGGIEPPTRRFSILVEAFWRKASWHLCCVYVAFFHFGHSAQSTEEKQSIRQSSRHQRILSVDLFASTMEISAAWSERLGSGGLCEHEVGRGKAPPARCNPVAPAPIATVAVDSANVTPSAINRLTGNRTAVD